MASLAFVLMGGFLAVFGAATLVPPRAVANMGGRRRYNNSELSENGLIQQYIAGALFVGIGLMMVVWGIVLFS